MNSKFVSIQEGDGKGLNIYGTRVRKQQPSDNFYKSNDWFLPIGWFGFENRDVDLSHIFLKSDLPNDFIQSTVEKATVKFYIDSTYEADTIVLKLSSPNSLWSHDTVTYNHYINDGVGNDWYSEGHTIPRGSNGLIEFDITSLAQRWANGSAANKGIFFEVMNTKFTTFLCNIIDAQNEENPKKSPIIELTYVPKVITSVEVTSALNSLSKFEINPINNSNGNIVFNGDANFNSKLINLKTTGLDLTSQSNLETKINRMKYSTINMNGKSKLSASHGFSVFTGNSQLKINMGQLVNSHSIINSSSNMNYSPLKILNSRCGFTGHSNMSLEARIIQNSRANLDSKSNLQVLPIVQANAKINIYNKSSLLLDSFSPPFSGFDDITENKPRELKLQVAIPSGRVIGNIPEAKAVNSIVKFGELNELSFKVPYLVDRNDEQVRNPNIDKLRERYLLKTKVGKVVEWYIINEIKEIMDQDGDSKEIHAFSLGYELKDKLIRGYQVTSKNLREVVSAALSSTIWSIGYIDSEFEIKRRQFDVTDKTVLDFIYEVAETFNAVIKFDTVNRQLHFINYKSSKTNNNPFRLSFRRYLKSFSKTSVPDDLVTRMIVVGKDGKSIQKINPTGSNYLESFEFFLYPFQRDENRNVISHSDYMEDDLCHAILDYQELIKDKQGQFKTLLEQLESKQAQLVIVQNELTLLEIDLSIIEDRLEVAKSQGNDTSAIEAEKATKQTEIQAKQAIVDGINEEIKTINVQIKQLQESIALEKVFSPRLLKERNKYILEQPWENEYISDEQELYDEAVKQFENVKKPKILMDIDIINFFKVLTEKRNWDKMSIGDDVYIHYEQFNLDILAKIIEIQYDYDNHSIKLTVANVREVETEFDKFYKQHYGNISTSKKVDMSEAKWNNTSDRLGKIDEMLENTWDATKRQILAGVNNSVEISKRGILVKDSEKPNEYLIMQNGVIAMTEDNGQTWKTAITPRYIVAERVAGKMIWGVNLAIENDSGTFRFDSNGATLDGAALTITNGGLKKENLDPSFADELVVRGQVYNGIRIDTESGLTVTRSDERVKAIFNATDGLKFQVKEGTQWKDKLYYDVNTSNLVIEGEINARGLKVHGKNVLTTDDKFDGSFISSITTDQLVAGTAKIKTAMIESLEVGRNVTMGANANISWGQIYNPPTAEQIGGLSAYSPRLTYIDAYGLYTGTIQADKIIGNTFVVDRGGSGSLEMYANGNDDRITSRGANGFRIGSNGSLSLSAGSSYKIATIGAPLVVESGMRVDYGTTQFYSTNNQGTVTINGDLNVTRLNVTGGGSGLVAVFG